MLQSPAGLRQSKLILPFRDDRLAVLAHHAEIALIQLEAHSLRLAPLQMRAPESAQCQLRRAGNFWELEI